MGPTTETGKGADTMMATFRAAIAASGAKEIVVKPGETIPLKGVDVKVLASNRQLIDAPVKGAANGLCEGVVPRRTDTSDNSASVGMLFTFGAFRFLDLGDMTQDLEFQMACPVNRIGEVDLFLTTHHGSGQSNAQVLVHALKSRVAIMNNGARKGGDLPVLQTIRSAPGLEDLWMLHYAVVAGAEGNVAEPMIANLGDVADPAVKDTGFGINVTVQPNGSFTVVNERNNVDEDVPSAAIAHGERCFAEICFCGQVRRRKGGSASHLASSVAPLPAGETGLLPRASSTTRETHLPARCRRRSKSPCLRCRHADLTPPDAFPAAR